MDSPLPSLQPADYAYSSGLSEADSLSDSDWLDISSKESDDNDSVSSDHDESDFEPPSRRSSMSIGSSRGEVEAWEGLAELSDDDEATRNIDIADISPLNLPPALRNSTASPRSAITHGDVLEEQFVKAALDQSMMSTLSASRTSSGHATTAQNSVRDLRLSFPDPLTSSRDELRTLYEVTSPSEVAEDRTIDPIMATSALDPGPQTTPAVLRITVRQDGESAGDDLEIVLYGSPVDMRWSIVENLMKKSALGADLTLTPIEETTETFTPLRIDGASDSIAAFPKSVTVIDRTCDKPTHYQSVTVIDRTCDKPTHYQDDHRPSKPSLAIIFLPARPFVPSTHTSFYPVFVPCDKDVSEARAIRNRVEARNWVMRNIPHGSVFDVGQFPIDYDDVSDLDAPRVWEAVQDLKAKARVVPRPRFRKDAQTYNLRMMGITGSLLALVVMLFVRGYVTGKAPTPTRPALTTQHLCARPGHIVENKTASPLVSTTAVIPSSLKDYAIAVFNPAPLVYQGGSAPSSSPGASSSKLPPAPAAVPQHSKLEKDQGNAGKPNTSSGVKSSSDLVLPGPSSLSLQERSKEVLALLVPKSKRAAEKAPEQTPTSLSIRLASSLSKIFDVKALAEVVPHDMKELSDAIDQLMIAIGEQTTAIMEESKGSSKVLRERLETRHGKAKSRAQDLKKMGGELGGQLLSYVEGEIKARAEQAKIKARDLAESFVLSDAWKAHQKRVDAHHRKMEARASEKQGRRVKRQIKRAKSMFSRA
ncbi:hypothetical protein HWV62_37894 [Athelia sp. TMB]|nr:hypothetical protein HWV62_37894 [Athelia sp. TMB]